MVAEIPVARGSFGGNHGQRIRQVRKGQFLLHVHVAPCGKLFDGPLAFQRLFSQGERRIYVFDEQGNAVQLTVTDLHLHQHGNTGLQRLTGSLFEVIFEFGIMPFPDHGAGFRHRLAAPALTQTQVAMPVGARTPGTDFRLHPIPPRKRFSHSLLDKELQVQQIHIIPRVHSLTKILIFSNPVKSMHSYSCVGHARDSCANASGQV